jgi:hypothetical protein
MKSKLLLSAILLSCSLLSPQPAHAWVFLNSTTFPDANFRSYISTLSGVKVGLLIDNNKVKEITYISCHDRGISSLKGIEYLTSVTRLECYNNTISSMDISKNTKLTMLNCYGNKLTSLDVSKNTALQTIYCSSNQLTSLDVTKNTALQKLECYSNSLSTLDLAKNTSLNYINCSTNSLTALDLSKNTGLTHIECQNNKISSLNVSNHTALQYITCYNNVLTSLNVSNDNAIDTLSCHINQLTTLDLSTNTGLTDLECFTNNLTSLDLSNCPKLTKVEFNNNKLNFVDLSHNSKLTYVNTQNNGRAVTAYSYTRAAAYGGGTGYYIPSLTKQETIRPAALPLSLKTPVTVATEILSLAISLNLHCKAQRSRQSMTLKFCFSMPARTSSRITTIPALRAQHRNGTPITVQQVPMSTSTSTGAQRASLQVLTESTAAISGFTLHQDTSILTAALTAASRFAT